MPLGQLYGLEKFWAFLKYSKAKSLEIDPKLQIYLSKFKRLEDFRIDVSVPSSTVDQWSSGQVSDLSPFFLQPPIEEGGRRRHSSSGDGRRRHPSQPSSRPHSQAGSGPSPAPTAQGSTAKDNTKSSSQKAPANDPVPDAKTLN